MAVATYKYPVHFYEVPVPGIYNYIKTLEATISNVCEDDQLCLHGIAIIDGQHIPVFGGRSSDAHAWKHFEYIPVKR